MDASGTTVLWRLFRRFDSSRHPARPAQGEPGGPERAHAVILPGGPPFTLAFFANGDMDRVENYDTMDLALFRADEIRESLIADDWEED